MAGARAPSRCLWAHGFRHCFTPLAGVLFTFPSRYWSTIGRERVFSLAGWSRQIPAGFHVPRGTQGSPPGAGAPFAYGALTPSGRPFQAVRLGAPAPSRAGPATPPRPKGPDGLGSSAFARRYWRNHCCFLFLRVLRWFTSPGSPRRGMCSRGGGGSFAPAGFPHSDTPGSPLAGSSPRLFAAGRVLHRLLSPRHPPCALSSLPAGPAPERLAPPPGLLLSDASSDGAPPGAPPGDRLCSLPYSPLNDPPRARWARLDLNQRPHPYQGCALTG